MPPKTHFVVKFDTRVFVRKVRAQVKAEMESVLLDIAEDATSRAPKRKVFRTKTKTLGGTRISAKQVEFGFVSTAQRNRAAAALRTVRDDAGRQRFTGQQISAFVNRSARSEGRESRLVTNTGQLENPVFEFFLNYRAKQALNTAQKAIRGGADPAAFFAGSKGAGFELGGRLKSSIESTGVEDTGPKMRGYVTVGAPYAAHVEFGTRHMKAQPYLRPAYQKQVGQYVTRMKRALEKVR